jgi:glycine dehydrogenase subunit 1
MEFIPNSSMKNMMLKEINLRSINELFNDIPKDILIKNLDIADGKNQQETEQHLRSIGEKNKSVYDMPCFLGGGSKPHYIPAAVKSITARSEFFSAYTPYQPEASQGFLQAMFEYQSLIAELTEMDISNASLYDGATALGESALMCYRLTKKSTFLIPKNISKEKKSVLRNYTIGLKMQIKEINYDPKNGSIDIDHLKKNMDSDVAGVYIENPNFFGIFEKDCEQISLLTQKHNSLFVVGVDPISLGIAKAPGSYGADIVIGEGKCFGNFIDYGGSTLGVFCCKKQHIRQIPGRIIGLTNDTDNKKAFCMTLQTREQHIRRGRATSNICTNEGLNALAATVHLSLLGGKGLQTLSQINFEKAQYLSKQIQCIPGFKKPFTGIHFNEFVIACSDAKKIYNRLLKKGIQGGLVLDNESSELQNMMLFGVTEMHTKDSIEQLLSALRQVN